MSRVRPCYPPFWRVKLGQEFKGLVIVILIALFAFSILVRDAAGRTRPVALLRIAMLRSRSQYRQVLREFGEHIVGLRFCYQPRRLVRAPLAALDLRSFPSNGFYFCCTIPIDDKLFPPIQHVP